MYARNYVRMQIRENKRERIFPSNYARNYVRTPIRTHLRAKVLSAHAKRDATARAITCARIYARIYA